MLSLLPYVFMATLFVSPAPLPSPLGDDRVLRVIDANTIRLEKTGKVRMAGIRTPTSPGSFPPCFPWEGDHAINNLLPSRQRVRVAILPSAVASDAPDAVVFLPSASSSTTNSVDIAESVNGALLKRGYARVRALPGGDVNPSLQRSENEGRSNHLGLWRLH